MSGQSGGGFLSVRPMLTRTRSSTSPAAPSNRNIDASSSDIRTPPRPAVGRSQSYVSSIERKPALPSAPLSPIPSEKPSESSRFPRLHLPGKLHHGQSEDSKTSHQKKHRYTQSESQQYHRKGDASNQETSAVGSSQHLGLPADLLYPSSRGTAIPSLMRIRSQRSYRVQPSTEDKSSGTRVRSNSDPKSPTSAGTIAKSKGSVQTQLERADLLRYAAHQNATKTDVERLDSKLKSAESELSTRIASDMEAASAIMQKLDQAHDTLHRSAESLLDTLSSFSSLAQQSSQLLLNFEKETTHLDSSIHQRISKHQRQIRSTRAERVANLEKRGRLANEKAASLGQRLENCRTIVDNWQRRETKKRKTWKGVRNGIIWGIILILIGAFAGYVSWMAIQMSEGEGTPQGRLASKMKNKTWALVVDDETGEDTRFGGANIPDDVRAVLRDIAKRAKNGPLFVSSGHGSDKVNQGDDSTARGGSKFDVSKKHVEKRLRLLDEL